MRDFHQTLTIIIAEMENFPSNFQEKNPQQYLSYNKIQVNSQLEETFFLQGAK